MKKNLFKSILATVIIIVTVCTGEYLVRNTTKKVVSAFLKNDKDAVKKLFSENVLKEYINKKSCYEIILPDDNNIIDYIVENNFRYLSCIDLYLPKRKIILQPSCHTEVFIYSKEYELVVPKIKEILKDYPEINLKKYNCGV